MESEVVLNTVLSTNALHDIVKLVNILLNSITYILSIKEI
jgi:hypothetical protein